MIETTYLVGVFIRPAQFGWSHPDTMTACLEDGLIHVVEWHPDRDARPRGATGAKYADEILSVEVWAHRVVTYGYIRVDPSNTRRLAP